LNTFGERAYDELATRAHSHDKLGYVQLVDMWERYKMILAEEKGRAA